MPTIKSAKKRMRQNVVLRLRNKRHKSSMKTQIKNFLASIQDHNLEKAQELLPVTMGTLDKMSKKGIFHKNKIARTKSNLQAKFNALASLEAEK